MALMSWQTIHGGKHGLYCDERMAEWTNPMNSMPKQK